MGAACARTMEMQQKFSERFKILVFFSIILLGCGGRVTAGTDTTGTSDSETGGTGVLAQPLPVTICPAQPPDLGPVSHSCTLRLLLVPGHSIRSSTEVTGGLQCSTIGADISSVVRVELGLQLSELWKRGGFNVSGTVDVALNARSRLFPATPLNSFSTAWPPSSSESAQQFGEVGLSMAEGNSDATVDDDWGITFFNVPHLQLVDSEVRGVPLSSASPLLFIRNCSYLSLGNVTIAQLEGRKPPAGSNTDAAGDAFSTAGGSSASSHAIVTLGALAAPGLEGASLRNVNCQNITSNIWACLLLQVKLSNGAVRVYDSVFEHNQVQELGADLPELGPVADLLGISSFQCVGSHESKYMMFGAMLVSTPAATSPRDAGTAADTVAALGCMSVDLARTRFNGNVGDTGGGVTIALAQGHLALRVSECELQNNRAVIDGAGSISACLDEAAGSVAFFHLLDSTFINNTGGGVGAPQGGGGAVRVRVHGKEGVGATSGMLHDVEVRGSVFIGNVAEGTTDTNGGALLLHTEMAFETILLENNSFVGNEAEGSGGAVALIASRPEVVLEAPGMMYIRNCKFTRNKARGASGGAVFYDNNAVGAHTYLRIDGSSSFSYNSGGSAGGALYAKGAQKFEVAGNSSFTHNVASGSGSVSGGGALYIGEPHTVRMAAVEFNSNHALGANGGAVSVSSENGQIATLMLGPNMNARNNSARNGGAVHASQDFAMVSIRDSEFFGNAARHPPPASGSDVAEGGGISSGNGGMLSLSTAALPRFELVGCTLVGNEATNWGGGVRLDVSAAVTNVTVAGTVIRGCRAGREGGAFYLRSTTSVALVQVKDAVVNNSVAVRSVLADNIACTQDGQGGGAMYIKAENLDVLSISGATLENNAARCLTCSGGAIHVDTGGGAIWDAEVTGGSELNNNTATADGGALYLTVNQGASDSLIGFTTLRVTGGSVFKGNTAKLGRGGAACIRSGNRDAERGGPEKFAARQHQSTDGMALPMAGTLNVSGEAVFTQNTAASGGGAVFADGFFEIDVEGATFANNTVTRSGGAGGALGLNRFPPRMTLAAVLFNANDAMRGSGGAVSVEVRPEDFTSDGSRRDSECLRCIMAPREALLVGSLTHGTAGWRSAIAVYNTTLTDNYASDDGGAMYLKLHEICCEGDVELSVGSGTQFIANNAANAGGALVFHNSRNPNRATTFKATIANSAFKQNAAGRRLGRGFVNTASQGGAVFIWNARELSTPGAANLTQDCSVAFTRTTFEGNACDSGYGGAVMLAGCTSRLQGCVFANNSAKLGGGALSALQNGFLESADLPDTRMFDVLASVSSGNSSSGGGACTCSSGSSNDSQRRVLTSSNTASSRGINGRGQASSSSADCTNGGVGFARKRHTSLVPHGARHRRRQLQTAAVLQESTGGTPTAASAATAVSTPPSTYGLPACTTRRLWFIWIDNCTFSGNFAELEYGGGLYADAGSRGLVVVSGSTFEANLAASGGGAFLVAGDLCSSINVTQSTFERNAAHDASAGGGGGLYLLLGSARQCAANVTRTAFEANSAAIGGGMEWYAPKDANMALHYNTFRSNAAAVSGGAAASVSDCGATVTVTGGRFFNNSAGWAGGALALAQRATAFLQNNLSSISSPTDGGLGYCREGSSVVWESSAAEDNRAGSFGGALFVAPGSAANIRNLIAKGDTVGVSGGSIAAYDCTHLTISESSFRGSLAGHSGGGVMASGCGVLLLDQVDVSQCAAGVAGGGIHLAEEGFGQQQLSSVLGLGSSSKNVIQGFTGSAVLSGVTLSGSRAGAAEAGFSRGGGIFLEGAGLAVGIFLSDLSDQNNTAALGSAIASTQRCKQSFSQDIDAIRIPAFIITSLQRNSVLQRWTWSWYELVYASAYDCGSLVIFNSLLPLGVTARYSVPVWVQDTAVASVTASCAPETADLVRSQRQSLTGSLLLSATEQILSPAVDLTAGSTTAPAPPPAAEDSGIAGKYLEEAIKYLTIRSNDTADDMDANTTAEADRLQSRFSAATAALLRCMPQQPVASDAAGGAQQRYSLTLPPTEMSMTFEQGGVWDAADENWLLQAGTAFRIAVKLLDRFSQPVVSDMAAVRITLQMLPRDPSGAAFTSATNMSASAIADRPWLNTNLANLDPGPRANSSLVQAVTNGIAMWREVVPRGWPGSYHLLFTAEVIGNDTGVPPITALSVPVQLLRCQVGKTLDLDTASQQEAPTWTACASCRLGQYGLWQDQRPPLVSFNTSDYLELMNATSYDAFNNEAACITCPANAACPGGAVLVPALGYWHSAPNSTAIHACPNPNACGGGDNADVDWAAPSQVVGPDGFVIVPFQSALADARSQLLGRCQREWYSSIPQGFTATSAYLARYNATSLAEVTNLPAASGNASADAGEDSTDDELACLLWGLSLNHADSYMQRQCAEGYTGNLCATCVPGYYINSDFECEACPTLSRTISLGLLAFFGNVALILFTTYGNFQDATDEDEGRQGIEPGEVLKAIVTHIQYFIIITRLNIDYPQSITRCQAVLNSATGAENYVAFSPSCLLPDRDSAGQAQIQLLAGLLTPVAVCLLCIGLWAFRYCFFFTGRVRRTRGGRMDHNPDRHPQQRASWLSRTFISSAARSAGDGYRGSSLSAARIGRGDSYCNTAAQHTVDFRGDQRLAGALGPVAEGFSNPAAPSAAYSAELPPPSTPQECSPGRLPQQHTSPPADTTVTQRYHSQRMTPDQQQPAGRFPPVSPINQCDEAMARGDSSRESVPAADYCQPEEGPKEARSAAAVTARGGLGKRIFRKVRAKTLSILEPHIARQSALVHVDQTLNMWEQLAIVLMVAVFVLYPGLAQAALSVFACYRIDRGDGSFADGQQATWKFGFWVRDMQQECYSGTHLSVYVPIGVVAVFMYCLLPPLVSYLLMWRHRKQLDDHHVGQVYGFLYKRYRERYWYWESVLQLETLALVAVEVFGRALVTSHQALLLLAVFLVIGAVNMTCSAMRSHFLVVLEFLSLSVLSLTVTLGLYFAIEGEAVTASEASAVGIIMLVINASLLVGFLCLAAVAVWPSLVEQARPKLKEVWNKAASKLGVSSCATCGVVKGSNDGRSEKGSVGGSASGVLVGGSADKGPEANDEREPGALGGWEGACTRETLHASDIVITMSARGQPSVACERDTN